MTDETPKMTEQTKINTALLFFAIMVLENKNKEGDPTNVGH